ncbi:hypothetical protein [Mycobacterium sp.]|uniref:hypothetical protein n=1 Tax=Mycobacterium sp. TaxID=1785 RepID=UPI003A8BC753
MRFRSGVSLGDVALLQQDLRELLGAPVEIISEDGLRGRFARRVATDATPL